MLHLQTINGLGHRSAERATPVDTPPQAARSRGSNAETAVENRVRRRSGSGGPMRARSSARGLGRSRVVKGNDERRKHCRYGTWLQRMVERLVTNLAMRKAKVRDDG